MTTGTDIKKFDTALLNELEEQLSSIGKGLKLLCELYQNLESPSRTDEKLLTKRFNEALGLLKGFYQKHAHSLDSKSDYFEQGLREIFDRQLSTFLGLGSDTDRLNLGELHDLAANYLNAGSEARKWIELHALNLIQKEQQPYLLKLWANAVYSSDGLKADYVMEKLRYTAEQRFLKLDSV